MNLEEKIQHSIEVIRKAEKMALHYSEEGFHLAFSGGKDSQVIYELAKMAGVKFQAYFYKTSIDPKELLSFIRNEYPEVKWLIPKKTMFQLMDEMHGFPTMRMRWCCSYLKERHGINQVTIIGIRKAESKKRSKRKEFTSECKFGGEKSLLSPILEWTDNDVWKFLALRKVKVCTLYQTQHRIGCIGCPMNSNRISELKANPNVMKAYINTAQKIINKYPEGGYAKNFKSGQDAFNWWVSGTSMRKYKAMRDLQGRLF